MKPIVKRRIFTPGPTPLLPEAMLQALVTPMHHRKADFKNLLREVQAGLGQVFKTQNEILILGCSGSGAMEAAMTNLLAPGEKALVAVAGKFGERWMELAQKFEIQASVVQVPYGQSVTAEQISAALAKDGGLDQKVAADWDGEHASLRRLVTDLIEEYGRHTGHADLLREAVDGVTGEDPPSDWRPVSGDYRMPGEAG